MQIKGGGMVWYGMLDVVTCLFVCMQRDDVASGPHGAGSGFRGVSPSLSSLCVPWGVGYLLYSYLTLELPVGAQHLGLEGNYLLALRNDGRALLARSLSSVFFTMAPPNRRLHKPAQASVGGHLQRHQRCVHARMGRPLHPPAINGLDTPCMVADGTNCCQWACWLVNSVLQAARTISIHVHRYLINLSPIIMHRSLGAKPQGWWPGPGGWPGGAVQQDGSCCDHDVQLSYLLHYDVL